MSRKYSFDQNRTPLYDAVRKFADWDPVPFFIPSHKMGAGVDPRFISFAGESIFKIDVSEVRWTDDFHGASSSIKEAQELAADAWGAARSHFLVNGTSGGIIAAICAACGDGDRIIVPRNAHKSAVYGLVVSGAEPVYVMPETCEGRGLVGGLAPEALERAFARCPDAKAVFTVSPTYHGVMSDTKALSCIAHRHGAVLIADEAHGNHMYFSGRLPEGALELGADIVCQSTHKMSGSLTQASMLHLGRDAGRRVDFDRVGANLSMIQTTSPSYILLASLDLARSYIATRGEALLDGVLDAVEKARAEIMALPGIEVLPRAGALGPDAAMNKFAGEKARGGKENTIVGRFGIAAYEPTRLVISAEGLGFDGYALFKILREEYGIECEFADPAWCVCVAGLGTKPAHTEALTSALAKIHEHKGDGSFCVVSRTKEASHSRQKVRPLLSALLPPLPPLRMTPREAWFAAKESVPFESSKGRVSAEMVVPYPPGIPVLCPGEEITAEVHGFLANQKVKGRHLHCSAGDGLETLSVVR